MVYVYLGEKLLRPRVRQQKHRSSCDTRQHAFQSHSFRYHRFFLFLLLISSRALGQHLPTQSRHHRDAAAVRSLFPPLISLPFVRLHPITGIPKVAFTIQKLDCPARMYVYKTTLVEEGIDHNSRVFSLFPFLSYSLVCLSRFRRPLYEDAVHGMSAELPRVCLSKIAPPPRALVSLSIHPSLPA